MTRLLYYKRNENGNELTVFYTGTKITEFSCKSGNIIVSTKSEEQEEGTPVVLTIEDIAFLKDLFDVLVSDVIKEIQDLHSTASAFKDTSHTSDHYIK